MHPTPRLPALTLAVALAVAASASARPAHKRALADHLGPFATPKLNDCRTCHLPDPPGKKDGLDEEKPHNPFGERLRDARRGLRMAGKPADVAAAVGLVADEDADGDGVPNLLELLTGHNPGDAADKPPPARVAEGRRTLVEFARRNTAYPWRPFDRVVRPPVPAVKNAGWVRNPIDAFVAAEHDGRGLTPRPEAPKAVLLRRVTLDLIGLPPSPDELRAFLADIAPDAYEKVVERLLNDPRHGERWGRHWMDVWRYSDWAGWTGGGQIRDSQPHVWRWRDWIVESVNADKGYDRMVVEMLAADEAYPDDPAALRATGYLVRNYKMLSREKWMQDTVDHTAQAFLGVTAGCAKCHDHMYDPITQKEYYALRAVFEPHQVRTDRVPGQPDPKKDGLVRAYDANLTVPTYFFVRGDDRTPDKSKPIPPGVPEALGGKPFKVEPVNLPAAAYAPDRRPFVVAEARQAADEAVAKAKAAASSGTEAARLDLETANARREALESVLAAEALEDAGKKNSDEWKAAATKAQAAQRKAAHLDALRNVAAAEQALAAADAKGKPAAEKKLVDARTAATTTEAALKMPATTAYTPRTTASYPTTSTGRRLALARWIADADNPLTARVAVNHVWLRHLGQPLVPRTFDFGRNGRPPSHPALLDWLAVEFMDRGWSMKHLHRLIVTSSTYRMDSTPDPASAKVDPDNTHLWRVAPRRLEAEAVRDCVFHVAGRLDATRGGPDIDYALGLTVPRRSLYFRHAPEKQMEFLKIFDAASPTECYMRKESILPQQALALINSDVARQHARVLARTLAAKVGTDPAAFTAAAFEAVLSRPPTADELAECAAFLKAGGKPGAKANPAADPDAKQPAADPALRAAENLVHVLLNHHEFVTIR